MEKEEHGQSLKVPGTLTRELTMMPVLKSLSEGETSNPQDYQEQYPGVSTGLGKGHLLSTQTGKGHAFCVHEVNYPGS